LKYTSTHFSRPVRWLGLFTFAALVLAACAPSGAAASSAYGSYGAVSPTATAMPAPTQNALVPVTGAASVQVANNPTLGKILVNAGGMTLYTFALDTNGVSKCTDSDCTADWPPYTVTTAPSAGADDQGKVGTLTRPDGSMQVTFNGQPLYTFVADKNPGDTAGDNVTEFGGIWLAARAAASAAPAGAAGTAIPPSSGYGGSSGPYY